MRSRSPLLIAAHRRIADELIISPLTAKTHVSNILRKLGCRDRAGLVALAYESRLVTPGEPAPRA